MSEEKKYFICRNEQCNTVDNYSGDSVSGGSIIEYKSPGKNNTFVCKHCQSIYKIQKGEIYLVWGENEKLIESNEEYKNFLNQYETKRIHFKKLSLKNIDESDYRGKNLSFTKCIIDELIIENVQITASFFPILFSECIINKIRISHCNIEKADRTTYKSLWNFFGINFFKCEIKESFAVDHCRSSMVVFDCKVKNSINFTKSSKVELALAYNKKAPGITADKTSDVKQLLEITGSDPSASEKKINTSGKTIRDIGIEELHVDPDMKEISTFENCVVHKLVFKAGSSIKGKLFFKNCVIESILNEPYCFEQDLIFLNCTFTQKIHIARSHFNQLLIFELCTFEQQASFNEIKVEEDFHLSYSAFKAGLVLSGNRCEGYIKCQINTFAGEVLFEDNIVARDVIFRSIYSENNLIFDHNELKSYLILRQISLKGDIDINMLNADALTIDSVAIDGLLNVGTLALNNDLNIGGMEAKKSVGISFAHINGVFRFERSSCEEYFNVYFIESGVNIIANNNIKGTTNFNSCTFSQQTFMSRNLSHDSFSWGTMNAHNITCNNNYFFKDFSLTTIQAKNISLDNNFADDGFKVSSVNASDIYVNENFTKQSIEISDTQAADISINNNSVKLNFEIKTTRANNLFFNDNKIRKEFNLTGSEFNNIKIYDNLIRENLTINDTKTDDIYVMRNKTRQETSLKYLFSRDLLFKENHTGTLGLLKSTFSEVEITECPEIGDTTLFNLNINGSFKIKDNIVAKEIYLFRCKIERELEIEYNIADDFQLLSSDSRDINFNRNYFSGQAKFSESGAEAISIIENRVKDAVQLIKIKSNNVNFENNDFYNSLEFNIIETDDIFISENMILQGLEIKFPDSDDLLLRDNNIQQISVANGNFTDISIAGSRNIDNWVFYNVGTKKNITIKENPEGKDIYLELCKVDGDIELTKNSFRALELVNTKANDIRITENKIEKLINLNDATANDITIQANNVASGINVIPGDGSHHEPTTDDRPNGLYIYQCSIEGELTLEANDIPELMQVNQTLADTLTLSLNITKALKVRSGKFRQLGVNNCTKVGEFYCNNVTISKDVSFKHNLFEEDFTMMYCKIENDLEFKGNIFKGRHRLFNNTILGSLQYETSTLEQEAENFIIHTTFYMNVLIQHNKFNFVSLENANVDATVYFENNTVQGSLRFGKADLSDDSPDMILTRALSMTENKINNASFIRLQLESNLCLHYNNIEADLTFQDITHQKSLDLTGCFVGGSFVFHNRRSGEDTGDLILDNAFVDKRISFNNYTPASFSFINATFSGFEIPKDWVMRSKKLVRKPANRLPGNIGLRSVDWFKRTFLGIDDFILKENMLQAGKFNKADLPYSLLKDHFDASERLSEIHASWKLLKTELFGQHDKLDKLVETHRREDHASDKDLLLKLYTLYNETIDYSYIPVYYQYYSEYGMQALFDGANHFAHIENNYKDDESRLIIEELKKFFVSFNEVLLAFRDHTIITPDQITYKEKQSLKNSITGRLEEQYRVLRHIWGDNGDLKEEDAAYYKWMHYKNMAEMHGAPLTGKPKFWMKYLLFEKVFGWGVDLFRIVFSTLGLVGIFAIIYYYMFAINPDLKVEWDGGPVYGYAIGGWKSIVFALQTTFSAGLGDWAPSGSGIVKIPMTINAILGVLFVTFLIGAYGRKMLR